MSLPQGEMFDPLDLRKKVLAKRSEFSFLPSYLGPFGMMKALQREMNKGAVNPNVNFYAVELSEYISFGKSFVIEQSQVHRNEEAPFVIAFARDAFSDSEFEESEALLEHLLLCFNDEELIPASREAYLSTILLGYMRIGRYFKGLCYAYALEEAASGGDCYEILGRYLSMNLSFPKAADAYLKGAEVFLKAGNHAKAARLACSGYAHLAQIPGSSLPTEEEIKKKYGEEAPIVLAYPKRLAIKHDPVEFAPEFQRVYAQAMEEAYDEFEKRGKAHAFVLWEAMEKAFAKRGIAWKNPQKMNPNVKFD